VHFASIKFCYFEYMMYRMSLYRIAIIIDNILGLQTSNSEKVNQYKFVQRGLLVRSKRPLIPAFFQPLKNTIPAMRSTSEICVDINKPLCMKWFYNIHPEVDFDFLGTFLLWSCCCTAVE